MEPNIKIIPVKTYYLEMREWNNSEKITFNDTFRIMRAEEPTPDFYKFLFISLGSEWGWTSRLLLMDGDLEKLIHNPLIEIYVLYYKGVPAGFFELDKSANNEVALNYFGLFKEFIGKGLGKNFILYTLDCAWSSRPERVILHTCEYDHPAALPLYLKMGFKIISEKIQQEIYPFEFAKKIYEIK